MPWLHRGMPWLDLRLVDDETWHRAQETRKARGSSFSPGHKGKGKAVHMLGGLLECGLCGGAFHTLYRKTWGCGHRQTGGPEACCSALRIPRDNLEKRVIRAVELHYQSTTVASTYADAIEKLAQPAKREALEAQQAELNRRLTNLRATLEEEDDAEERSTNGGGLASSRINSPPPNGPCRSM